MSDLRLPEGYPSERDFVVGRARVHSVEEEMKAVWGALSRTPRGVADIASLTGLGEDRVRAAIDRLRLERPVWWAGFHMFFRDDCPLPGDPSKAEHLKRWKRQPGEQCENCPARISGECPEGHAR